MSGPAPAAAPAPSPEEDAAASSARSRRRKEWVAFTLIIVMTVLILAIVYVIGNAWTLAAQKALDRQGSARYWWFAAAVTLGGILMGIGFALLSRELDIRTPVEVEDLLRNGAAAHPPAGLPSRGRVGTLAEDDGNAAQAGVPLRVSSSTRLIPITDEDGTTVQGFYLENPAGLANPTRRRRTRGPHFNPVLNIATPIGLFY